MTELTLEQKEQTLKGILSAVTERMERLGTRGFERETVNLREISKLRDAYKSLVGLWGMERGWITSFEEIDEAFGF